MTEIIMLETLRRYEDKLRELMGMEPGDFIDFCLERFAEIIGAE